MSDNHLLRIELDELDKVPRIFYKGKEITCKVAIKFEWETKTDRSNGVLHFKTEYYVSDSKGYVFPRNVEIKRQPPCQVKNLKVN